MNERAPVHESVEVALKRMPDAEDSLFQPPVFEERDAAQDLIDEGVFVASDAYAATGQARPEDEDHPRASPLVRLRKPRFSRRGGRGSVEGPSGQDVSRMMANGETGEQLGLSQAQKEVNIRGIDMCRAALRPLLIDAIKEKAEAQREDHPLDPVKARASTDLRVTALLKSFHMHHDSGEKPPQN